MSKRKQKLTPKPTLEESLKDFYDDDEEEALPIYTKKKNYGTFDKTTSIKTNFKNKKIIAALDKKLSASFNDITKSIQNPDAWSHMKPDPFADLNPLTRKEDIKKWFNKKKQALLNAVDDELSEIEPSNLKNNEAEIIRFASSALKPKQIFSKKSYDKKDIEAQLPMSFVKEIKAKAAVNKTKPKPAVPLEEFIPDFDKTITPKQRGTQSQAAQRNIPLEEFLFDKATAPKQRRIQPQNLRINPLEQTVESIRKQMLQKYPNMDPSWTIKRKNAIIDLATSLSNKAQDTKAINQYIKNSPTYFFSPTLYDQEKNMTQTQINSRVNDRLTDGLRNQIKLEEQRVLANKIRRGKRQRTSPQSPDRTRSQQDAQQIKPQQNFRDEGTEFFINEKGQKIAISNYPPNAQDRRKLQQHSEEALKEPITELKSVMVFGNHDPEDTFVFKEMYSYAESVYQYAESAYNTAVDYLKWFTGYSDDSQHKDTVNDLNKKANKVVKKALKSGDLTDISPTKNKENQTIYKNKSSPGYLEQTKADGGKYNFIPKDGFTGVLRVERLDANGNPDPKQVDLVEFKDGEAIAVSLCTPKEKTRIADIGKFQQQAIAGISVSVKRQQQHDGINVSTPQIEDVSPRDIQHPSRIPVVQQQVQQQKKRGLFSKIGKKVGGWFKK